VQSAGGDAPEWQDPQLAVASRLLFEIGGHCRPPNAGSLLPPTTPGETGPTFADLASSLATIPHFACDDARARRREICRAAVAAGDELVALRREGRRAPSPLSLSIYLGAGLEPVIQDRAGRSALNDDVIAFMNAVAREEGAVDRGDPVGVEVAASEATMWIARMVGRATVSCEATD